MYRRSFESFSSDSDRTTGQPGPSVHQLSPTQREKALGALLASRAQHRASEQRSSTDSRALRVAELLEQRRSSSGSFSGGSAPPPERPTPARTILIPQPQPRRSAAEPQPGQVLSPGSSIASGAGRVPYRPGSGIAAGAIDQRYLQQAAAALAAGGDTSTSSASGQSAGAVGSAGNQRYAPARGSRGSIADPRLSHPAALLDRQGPPSTGPYEYVYQEYSEDETEEGDLPTGALPLALLALSAVATVLLSAIQRR